MITTTLRKIKDRSPREDVWASLLKHLGKTKCYDEPLKFSTILGSNELEDILWCLRSICPEHDKEVRLFAADCADSVLHLFEKEYPKDKRPREAIQAARDFAEGKITEDALSAAWRDAWDAVGDDRDATRAILAASWAARTAAWSAVSAARDTAMTASWAASWASAWDAARDIVGETAFAAAMAAQSSEKAIQTKLLLERFG